MYNGDQKVYFGVGRSGLECVALSMLAAQKSSCRRILDFACGHGRVLRWLRNAFPSAEITACDIVADAVEFCARTFQAMPVVSSDRTAAINLKGPYDLIWCGSLLTHVDITRCRDFLALFHSLLAPGGLLISSFVGRVGAFWARDGIYDFGLSDNSIASILRDYDHSGHGYVNYDWNCPLGANYGIAMYHPSRMCSLLNEFPELRLVGLMENGWAEAQDVFACSRVDTSSFFALSKFFPSTWSWVAQ
jgi:SAM-dependent methyltransferase